MSDLHVVLGAGGAVGSTVVRELLARGHRVRAVQRGALAVPDGVEAVRADVSSPEGARQACVGAAVVHHCAQPGYDRWARELVPLTRAVLAGAEAAGAKLVVADNLYMYGPVDGPMTEDLPYSAADPKGRVRAEVADLVLGAHREGRLRTTMGRASDYFGPRGVGTVLGPTVFEAALAGRTARWIGPLDVPHTVSYLPDVAAGLVTLAERPEADGHAWHLPAAPPVTGHEFLALVGSALGRPLKQAGLGRGMQRLIGLANPTVRALGETWYQRDRPFVADTSRYDHHFGPAPATPLPQAVATTLAWYGTRAGSEPSAIDRDETAA